MLCTQKVYFDWVYGLGICKLINMRICCVIVFFLCWEPSDGGSRLFVLDCRENIWCRLCVLILSIDNLVKRIQQV